MMRIDLPLATRPKRSAYPLLLPLLMLWLSAPSLRALTLLSSNQLQFVCLDHAAMGACSTFTYGYKGDYCGAAVSTSWYAYPYGGGGMLVALSNNSGLRILPTVASAASISSNASVFPDASIRRTYTPCTDEYTITGAGLSFTHYTPAWQMTNFTTSTLSEKKRFFLPATWLSFTITNTNSTSEDFYMGLPSVVTPRTFANGAYQGATVQGEAAVAAQSGSCEFLSGSRLLSVFSGMTNGFAFHVNVSAGQTRSLTIVIAFYRSSVVDSRIGSVYYYTSLYPSIDSVIDTAFAGFGDTQMRCQQLATVFNRANLNPFRRFLASHGLHSYMADTACLLDPQGGVHWWEMEGIFQYINTFDLTIDHAFYDCIMHPWALRNVLDANSGALPGTGYSYETPLYNPSSTQVSTHGFSFYHDMGTWPTSSTGPSYGGNMGDEELQSWILSAGLYWSHTADHAWLTNNLTVLQTCLNSMLLRDHTNAASRDGITKNVNSGEITTFDSLDSSLVKPAYSGRLAVRNWACYLALNAMFAQVGDSVDATACQNMAATAAQTIVNLWNTYLANPGYIPALLDGSITSATTPMVEGLAYPAAMGLTNAVDRAGGPYATMLQALSNHIVASLVSGKCLDATSGGWRNTSSSTTVWQSKVFIDQYVAEAILGITNDVVNGSVDQVHASIQIQDAPFAGFADAVNGTGVYQSAGGNTYPRGVTSVLWWLNATNSPSNLAATSAPPAPTISVSLAGDHQVLLLWQGVPFATGYNLKRATISGGPYTATNAVGGASFTDTNVSNGSTYYYILTATNQIGESSPSAQVRATPVPSVGSTISAKLTASTITISWPSNYIGWVLQTNTVGLRNPAWGDVPASLTNSLMTFPASGANTPAQFFRLRHP